MRCARIADSARIVWPSAARAVEIGEDVRFLMSVNFSEGADLVIGRVVAKRPRRLEVVRCSGALAGVGVVRDYTREYTLWLTRPKQKEGEPLSAQRSAAVVCTRLCDDSSGPEVKERQPSVCRECNRRGHVDVNVRDSGVRQRARSACSTCLLECNVESGGMSLTCCEWRCSLSRHNNRSVIG